MKRAMLLLVAGIVMLSCSTSRKASKKSVVGSGAQNGAVVKTETTAKDTAKNGMKQYKDVITAKAITQNGLFKVHKVEDRYFFEIPDTLFNRDILIVSRISKAPPFFGNGGDQIGENVIQFVKGPGRKFFLKRISFLVRAGDSTENGMVHSVQNSNFQPITAVFEVKAYTPDSSAVVIDMTDYMNQDNDVLYFGYYERMVRYKVEGYQPDRSYIEGIRSYPMNIELKTVKTYLKESITYTFELNSSIVLLPKEPMQARYWDKRLGFFTRHYFNYASDEPVEMKEMITRWRLEPKDEDIEKYKAGELVEPKKPIVYYIDPATPKKWVPWLIKGVNDWQQAFEKAGFKNAICAKEAPTKEEDSTWSIDDARHNVIVYKASDVPNASGPQVSDPRSGEILETHINWYHNVLELVHDWYMIQAGPNDPKARKMKFEDSVMGRLIQYVCTHEVGHTLGLRHNFLASTAVPTDSLRSKKYVDANGICPSIMDYARFNYVAQPEDGFTEKELLPKIGVYDEWAIEWGYKWLTPFKSKEEETDYLTSWVNKRVQKDKRLWFGEETYAIANNDPTRQSEDLGDDPVKSGYYGIQNLKRLMPRLQEWTKTPNGDYNDLKKMSIQVWNQYFRYVSHVATNIGGVIWAPKYIGEAGETINYPDRKTQEAAVKFLVDNVFTTPTWLLDHEIFRLVTTDPSFIKFPGYMHLINILQRTILQNIVSHKVTDNLLLAQTSSNGDHYTVDELFTDLESGIWQEIKEKKPVDIYRRNLQKLYTERLIELIGGFNAATASWDRNLYPVITITDVYPIIKSHLKDLLKLAESALPAYKDKVTRLHLIEIRDRIKEALYKQDNNGLTITKPADRSRALQGDAIQSVPVKEEYRLKQSNCWGDESSFTELIKDIWGSSF